MMNFSTLQGLAIPEGVVTQIADASGRVLWSSTIKFTINGGTYIADMGMTWAEWFTSAYNTTGTTIDDVSTITDSNGNTVNLTDVIVGGATYGVGFIKTLGEYAIGSSVFLNVGGKSTEFIVVHQGLPDTRYDISCNGTWLLMKDIYKEQVWHKFSAGGSTFSDYKNSDTHMYLNGAFFELFDDNIKNVVKSVKIPYATSAIGNMLYGADGLFAKVFLLSQREISYSLDNEYFDDGAPLAYFSGLINGATPKRVAYLDGIATQWWLRTPKIASSSDRNHYICYITATGYNDTSRGNNTKGIRPAIILPSDFII